MKKTVFLLVVFSLLLFGCMHEGAKPQASPTPGVVAPTAEALPLPPIEEIQEDLEEPLFQIEDALQTSEAADVGDLEIMEEDLEA